MSLSESRQQIVDVHQEKKELLDRFNATNDPKVFGPLMVEILALHDLETFLIDAEIDETSNSN